MLIPDTFFFLAQVTRYSDSSFATLTLTLDYEQSPFFLRDSKARERRGRVLTRGDFHALSRFASSTIPEEKWGHSQSTLTLTLQVVQKFTTAIQYHVIKYKFGKDQPRCRRKVKLYESNSQFPCYETKLYHVVTVSLEPLIMSREQKGTKTKRNSVLHIDQGNVQIFLP